MQVGRVITALAWPLGATWGFEVLDMDANVRHGMRQPDVLAGKP